MGWRRFDPSMRVTAGLRILRRAGTGRRVAARVGWLLASALLTGSSQASDRPYRVISSAAAEEDAVGGELSLETWASRLGPVRAVYAAPEYTFEPTTSLQLELVSARERDAHGTASGAGLEFKHLFNHLARDGYGWGIVVSFDSAKEGSGVWRRDEWGMRVPLTVSLWEGEGLLHLNAGFTRLRDEREWITALALEREVFKRTVLFGEIAHIGDSTLLHTGVRYWIRREKLAVDFSLQRLHIGVGNQNGGVVGIAWYEL
jgi:hypothetical protein